MNLLPMRSSGAHLYSISYFVLILIPRACGTSIGASGPHYMIYRGWRLPPLSPSLSRGGSHRDRECLLKHVYDPDGIHNFAFAFASFSYSSTNTRRNIFPVGDFGIYSKTTINTVESKERKNSQPPQSRCPPSTTYTDSAVPAPMH